MKFLEISITITLIITDRFIPQNNENL
jgi:hypothetical protein